MATKNIFSLPLDAFGRIVGADGGYNDSRDVKVSQTADGASLNDIWGEFQESVGIRNAERNLIIDLLTFNVTAATEAVTQLSSAKFERAGEYSEPRGTTQKPATFWLGYGLDWFDIANRYTWRYLADASQEQVEAVHASVLEGDNQNVFAGVLSAIYDNQNRVADINDQEVNVYALYNADGTVPPNYKTNTFTSTHTHYMVSGAATVDSGDLDDLVEALSEHGYSSANGVQLVICLSSKEGKEVRKFRIASGDTYDFIPAQDEPLDLILNPGQSVAGQRPAGTHKGLKVIGKYGSTIVVEDDLFPPGYVMIFGTGGKNNLNNPVGMRQHQNPSMQGLRLVKGPDNDYPLVDSFYQRGFGTGIRQRGGAAVVQIKASGSYAPPANYVA